MRRRVLFVSVLVTFLSGAFALGWTGYRDHESDAQFEAALARLHAPLAEAPGLDRIQASTAASLLERAEASGRRDDQLIGTLAYARALEDFQRGDFVLADGELTSARHRLGHVADVEVLAAAVARGRRHEDEANAILMHALELDPEHAHGRLLAADLALDANDGVMALTHLDRLGERGDEVSAVANRRGLALELLGDEDAARAAYTRAVQLDGRAVDGWINLGRLHRNDGRHAQALRAFDHGVRAATSNPDAHLGRGLARAATGDVAGAQIDFARAAELAPNDAEPLLALGDLLRDLGRHEDAVDTYRRAIAREDADAASWLKLGNALALLERYEEAATAFRESIARASTLAAAHNGLGASLMHVGMIEEAVSSLDRAAALDANDPNPLMNLALLHERAGETDAARDAWSRALERAPGSTIARRRLARL
jgi:tetratricopeptide (TPR) repeat protein